MQIGSFELGLISVITVLMLCLFIFASRLKRNVHLAASIITVLGILGTFVGIAYGLYMFDETQIEQSIPSLLAGLKIAFLTSIIGIFLSIVITSILHELENNN